MNRDQLEASVAKLDRGLLLAIIALIGIGLVQVYSSSYIFATESRGNGLFYFQRQLSFLLVAIPALCLAALTPWRWFERFGFLLWIFAAIGVALTFVPGLGISAGGAARWLNLPGGAVFEPSEVLKLALPFAAATFFVRDQHILARLPLWMRVAVIAVPLILVVKQRDFGSFAICVTVALCLMFTFGMRLIYFAVAAAVAVPVFAFLIMSVPYRRARIAAFLDPWADPAGKGFQVIQSMLSIQSGGLTGAGLGQGQGKLFFLPEAHTDFTLAVLGEEMGFIGICIVLMIYAYCVVRGLQIASRSENPFAKCVALGLSLIFAFQVFINVGVNLGLLPTKGLTLPFLSYGGSSLLASCLLFGFLLNIERQERVGVPSPQTAARLYRSRHSTSKLSRRRR